MHAHEFLQRYGPAAVVTGASSGIGEAFASLLAKGGFDVVLVARRRQRLDALAARLRDHEGVEVRICEADLSDTAAVKEVEAACEGWDIGLLVSNAGFGLKGRHEATDALQLQSMIAVNCTATALLTRAFIPRLATRDTSGIIITSSVESLLGFPYSAAYAASKAFATSLGEGLWGELRDRGVDVLALLPGSTDTETHDLQGIDRAQLSGMMSPREVAQEALDNILEGPTLISGEQNRALMEGMAAAPRRDAILGAGESMKQVLLDKP